MMKKTLILTFIIALFMGCNNDDIPQCFTISNLNFENDNNVLVVSGWQFDGDNASNVTLEFGESGFTQGTGQRVQIFTATEFRFENLQRNQNYDFYIKNTCENGSESPWAGPFSFFFEDICVSPIDVRMGFSFQNLYTITWDDRDPENPSNFFEVEYGPQGFTIGQGIRDNYPNNGNIDYVEGSYEANTAYDFYVRANCGPNQWSDWSEPFTFLTTSSSNVCNVPTNVDAAVDRNFFGDPVLIAVSWDWNGESDFEISITSQSDLNNPDQGQIFTHNNAGSNPTYSGFVYNRRYKFFVRSVCKGGTERSAWSVGDEVVFR